jgi:hypothetical protein
MPDGSGGEVLTNDLGRSSAQDDPPDSSGEAGSAENPSKPPDPEGSQATGDASAPLHDGQTQPSSPHDTANEVSGAVGHPVSEAEPDGTDARAQDALEETDAPEGQAGEDQGGEDQDGEGRQTLRPAATEQFQLEVTVGPGIGDGSLEFILPTSGGLDPAGGQSGFYGKSYSWDITWGDGSPQATYTDTVNPDGPASQNDLSAPGISHTYPSAGIYVITIAPTDPAADAWLGSFGFRAGHASPASAISNKAKVSAILTGFTPQMTRSAAQIANPAAGLPSNEWEDTFAGCYNLTTTGPGFGSDWAGITSTGYSFAKGTFMDCSSITMHPAFNLPQDLVSVEESFAVSLFYGCSGDAFTMNSVFNLPPHITDIGMEFADGTFAECSGAAFTMNSVFNLPQGITGVAKTAFATSLFSGCSGDAFTMNSVFNLPQGITIAHGPFLMAMFSGCSGASFTMNSVFNLPPGISGAIDSSFGAFMFARCSGDAFTMNSVFNLPQGITSANDDYILQGFFADCSGDAFTMNSVFNLPQGITGPVGVDFGAYMFEGCSSPTFTMNNVFNLPPGISGLVGRSFGASMFEDCSGAAFTMNNVFTFPQGITDVEEYFAHSLFKGCSGAAFTMNGVFNLPQGITALDFGFAKSLFANCSGAAFQVNDIFTFPQITQVLLDVAGGFEESFAGLNTGVKQRRSAISIINNPNGNPPTPPFTIVPNYNRYTFEDSFSDWRILDANWGGMNDPSDCVVTFDTAGSTAVSFPAGDEVQCLQGGLVPLPVILSPSGSTALRWFKDPACTQEWLLDSDTIPVGTAAMTLYLGAFAASPLTFTPSGAFDIPGTAVGTAIRPIDTYPGVSGGVPSYTFSAAGLPPGLAIDPATGIISGTPTLAVPAGIATITVQDTTGQTASITLNYGAMTQTGGGQGGQGGGSQGGLPDSGDALMPVILGFAVVALASLLALAVLLLRRRRKAEGPYGPTSAP